MNVQWTDFYLAFSSATERADNEIVRGASISTCKSFHGNQVSLIPNYPTITLFPASKLSNYQPCYALSRLSVTTTANTSQKGIIPIEPWPENIRTSIAFSAAYDHVLLKWKTVCQRPTICFEFLQCVTLCY